jgi:hypothetical protein
VRGVIGREQITWGAVEHWIRKPETTPVEALERFAAALRERGRAMLVAAGELEKVRAQKLAKPRIQKGWGGLELWRQRKREG